MTVLGIDPSLTSTGLVVFNDSGEMLEYRLIKTQKMRGMARLKFIKDEILQLIAKYNITHVAIESYAYGVMKSKSKFNLGELGGVLRLTLYEKEIHYLDVAPPTLKKYVTGRGDADKLMVIECVKKRWGVDFEKKSDLADAYGLAKIAFDQYKLGIDLKKTIKEMTKQKTVYL